MPVLEQSRHVDLVVDFIQVLHQLVLVFAQVVLVVVPLWQASCLQHLENEHRVVGSEAAATLGDDVGVLDAVFVASVHQLIDRVVDILLDGVVHAVLAGAVAGAVVVHSQAAANVDEVDVEAQLGELHIELASLAQRVLDAANLGHLAAYVEMDELEAVDHLVAGEEVHGGLQLAGVESKLAAVAAALLPLAAAAAR